MQGPQDVQKGLKMQHFCITVIITLRKPKTIPLQAKKKRLIAKAKNFSIPLKLSINITLVDQQLLGEFYFEGLNKVNN